MILCIKQVRILIMVFPYVSSIIFGIMIYACNNAFGCYNYIFSLITQDSVIYLIDLHTCVQFQQCKLYFIYHTTLNFTYLPLHTHTHTHTHIFFFFS